MPSESPRFVVSLNYAITEDDCDSQNIENILASSSWFHLDNCIVLSRDIPTTKICLKCGSVHEMKLYDRTFECCNSKEDRDIHAAKNMIEIFNLIRDNLQIPQEQRKFKREEFL